MPFDIKLTFPKTPPTPKSQVLARVTEIKRKLRIFPCWMINPSQKFLVGCVYPSRYKDVPSEFSREYYKKNLHTYETEARKSSKVILMPYFFLPKEEIGITHFQLFSKIKKRIDLKQIWEYLMLDLWRNLLHYYSQSLQITLKAPVPVVLENDSLVMSFNTGSIGDYLHKDFDSALKVALPFGTLTLYQAFALHLGALAHIKEAEELKHNDYQLRHVLFDPGNLLDPYFYYVRMSNIGQHKPTLVDPFLTTPSLSITDVEHSLREPRPKVQEENENLLMKARNYTASHGGMRPFDFEKAYRDGYDMVEEKKIVQKFVDEQNERWGFSVDSLYKY